jgi:alpha-ribazole phosphatase
MRLILIRHPRPVIAAGLCYGSSDISCTTAELKRATAHVSSALDALKPAVPRDVPIFSSPLQRCAALAQRLPGTGPSYDERLVEIDFGAWEMQAWDAIPRQEIDAWAADVAGYRPGGGESVLDVAARVSAFDTELRQSGHECAIVVCHAGTMRLLAACRPGRALVDMAMQAAATPNNIAYGGMLVLDY